jgi:hypothetical protein
MLAPPLPCPEFGKVVGLWHLFALAKQATSEQFFKLIINGFDPNSTWMELNKQQRDMAKGNITHQEETIQTNAGLALPNPTLKMSVHLCGLDRNRAGQLFVRELQIESGKLLKIHSGEHLKSVKQFQFFQNLNLATPGKYIYIYFDPRFSRETLLSALGEQEQFWESDPDSGASRLKSEDVHVIPSNEPPFAILIAPVSRNLTKLAAAFHTQLKAARRAVWFPKCVEHWKTLKVECQQARRNPDGSFQQNQDGFPILETISRPLFKPKEHLKRKTSTGKFSARRWLALATLDMKQEKKSLFKRTPETNLLISQCRAWRAYNERSAKLGKRIIPEERKARRASCHELRKCQTHASKQLATLDKTHGRLDKNFSHWVKQNSKLDHSGFFAAAAKMPTK